MCEEGYWNIGDIIVLRGVGKQGIWYTLPVFVVQDTSKLIALYWPAGTKGKWRMKSPGAKVTPQDVVQTPMEIIDRTWDQDEDQLEEAVALGLFTKAEAVAIRTEGERVINLIRENRPPICDGWEKWLPPTKWNVPKLRVDWNMGFDPDEMPHGTR